MKKYYEISYIIILLITLPLISCISKYSNDLNKNSLNILKDANSLKDTNAIYLKQSGLSEDIQTENHISSSRCLECHYRIIWEWGYTFHGKTFNDLRNQGDFSCQTCHSNKPINPRESFSPFAIIHCECCHEHGTEHMEKPHAKNILISKKKTCALCHSKLKISENDKKGFIYSPFHELIYTKNMINEIDIRGYIQDVLDNSDSSGRLRLDLFVMSMCPYGIMAENRLLSLVKQYKNILKFNIYYIAHDLQEKERGKNSVIRSSNETSMPAKAGTKEDENKDSAEPLNRFPYQTCMVEEDDSGLNDGNGRENDARFRSLHGQMEVEEDIRQLVIMRYYPDKWIDYILQRNVSIINQDNMEWEVIAEALGLDLNFLKEKIRVEGDDLLAKNLETARERKIKASPTLFINDVLYVNRFDNLTLNRIFSQFISGLPYDREIGIKKIPEIECASDSDCILKDSIGICIKPDTVESRCTFYNMDSIYVDIINDESNPILNTSHYINFLMRSGNRIKPHYIPYDSVDGIKYISQYNIKTLPFFIFNSGINNPVFSEQMSPYLVKIQDKVTFAKNVINPKYLIPGDFLAQNAEVFLNGEDIKGVKVVLPFLEDLIINGQTVNFSYYYPVQNVGVEKDLSQSHDHLRSSDGEYRLESAQISHRSSENKEKYATDNLYSLQDINISLLKKDELNPDKEYEESLRQSCILKHFSNRFLYYLKNRSIKIDETQDLWMNGFSEDEISVINRCIYNNETIDVLKIGHLRTQSLGINEFPTFLFKNKILVGGNEYLINWVYNNLYYKAKK